ncbi:MAG: hypothetical protein K6C94_06985 [Candidatus Gastranaerophilales bacterium]|nr:hypothetical protein [Candidatus Gastranaerophilales bacterium]
MQVKLLETNLCHREESIIFVDYDAMLEKCAKCTMRHYDEKECFKGRDIFFCSKREKPFGDRVCLCCYEDFKTGIVDFEQYFIYGLTGHKEKIS